MLCTWCVYVCVCVCRFYSGVDTKKASRMFSQKFACGVSTIEDQGLLIQGDVVDELIQLLKNKFKEVRIFLPYPTTMGSSENCDILFKRTQHTADLRLYGVCLIIGRLSYTYNVCPPGIRDSAAADFPRN